ncbi:Proteinase inhibitor I25, cystatin, conserved region [Trema orientale]|uniref:Proteinase inhibitor I25, cystatin, conserved region n=1 Tax=Trema orientale TaxID=63057 RepID=A0A2P5EX25_TREOI|nr:Proteinase inhibitor I25, cystatin, conserved region [Trema orientale]
MLHGGLVRCHPEFEGARDAARFAVENHNEFQGTNLLFKRVVKANAVLVRGLLLFITLQTCDGSFYEAKVLSKFIHPQPSDDKSCEFTVHFFGPAIHYKG